MPKLTKIKKTTVETWELPEGMVEEMEELVPNVRDEDDDDLEDDDLEDDDLEDDGLEDDDDADGDDDDEDEDEDDDGDDDAVE